MCAFYFLKMLPENTFMHTVLSIQSHSSKAVKTRKFTEKIDLERILAKPLTGVACC